MCVCVCVCGWVGGWVGWGVGCVWMSVCVCVCVCVCPCVCVCFCRFPWDKGWSAAVAVVFLSRNVVQTSENALEESRKVLR